MIRRSAPFLVILLLVALPVLEASGQLPALNDLFAFGQGDGQEPARVATARRAEPPFVATPRAVCGPGAKPEPGIQGRVPAGAAREGLRCNVSLVAHQGTSGGFKVLRYIDPAGHECAYYDTALLYPINALKLDTTSQGVAVLDMSDPAHPKQTATLTELPMMSPHESLNLNAKRGLLAAVLGNPSTHPGLVSIYDVSQDCRQPKLQSTRPVARLGHESGFSPDGKTFYATSTGTKSITGVDVTNPKEPHAIWQGKITSHGMSLSPDGNRAYIADPDGQMLILDVSEIQARKANPQSREVSRLTWRAASIPQNAIPFTSGGKPYILEIDEYTQGTTGGGDKNEVGAARIIDIADERAPRVVANLRLQVNQPADHAAASSDPGATSPVQGYAAHYCNFDRPADPTVVACSFITSGLRVFDISDLLHPKEIAYYVAPTQPRAENGFMESSFAMSQPAIIGSRREVWYSDGATGFNVLRVAESVWPKGIGVGRGGRAARLPPAQRGGPPARHRPRSAWASRRRPCRRRGARRSASGAIARRAAPSRPCSPSAAASRSWPAPRAATADATCTAGRTGGPSATASSAPSRGSTRVFAGVRRGKARYVAIASRRTIARRALLRRYLRVAF